MKFILMLITVALTMTGCVMNNAHLIVTCADGAGVGQFLGLGGNVHKLTHSDEAHVFSEREIALLESTCAEPRTAESVLMEQLLGNSAARAGFAAPTQ